MGAVVVRTSHPSFCDMGEFKNIKELIDEYYPELAERLRNGERNGK